MMIFKSSILKYFESIKNVIISLDVPNVLFKKYAEVVELVDTPS